MSLLSTNIKENRLAFWAYEFNSYEKIILVVSFAILTGISAQLRIYLWFTPVPITLQVICVLASGMALGQKHGALSQMIYVVLGVLGIPWFAGGNRGIETMIGATGGYLVGFILAAALIGRITEETILTTKKGLFYGNLCAIAVIYLLGGVWLALTINISWWNAFLLGVAPFIVLDFAKSFVIACCGSYLLPQQVSET